MPVVYDPEHILEDEARTDGVTGRTILPKMRRYFVKK